MEKLLLNRIGGKMIGFFSPEIQYELLSFWEIIIEKG